MMTLRQQLTIIPHFEDLIYYDGGKDIIDSFLHQTKIVASEKFDGSPAVYFGWEGDRFFVATKAIFNKKPKINYSIDDIKKNHSDPTLAAKLIDCYEHLQAVALKNGLVYCGDYIGRGKSFISPNVLVYEVPTDILTFVVHTKFTNFPEGKSPVGLGDVYRPMSVNLIVAPQHIIDNPFMTLPCPSYNHPVINEDKELINYNVKIGNYEWEGMSDGGKANMRALCHIKNVIMTKLDNRTPTIGCYLRGESYMNEGYIFHHKGVTFKMVDRMLFSYENFNNRAVYMMARMNPIHYKHAELINKFKEYPDQFRKFFCLSKQEGNRRNPLPYEFKKNLIERNFGVKVEDWGGSSYDHLREISDLGYKRLTIICGSDRQKKYQEMVDLGIRRGDFQFHKVDFDVIVRNTDGISSTKMRECAKECDRELFMAGLPHELDGQSEIIYMMCALAGNSYKMT